MWHVEWKEKYMKGLGGEGWRKEMFDKNCMEMGGIYPK